MKQNTLKLFLLLFIFAILIANVNISYSQLCAANESEFTWTFYTNMDCDVLVGADYTVYFWTNSPTFAEYRGYTNANGQIIHCFPLDTQIWFAKPDGYDCNEYCIYYFTPTNGSNPPVPYVCLGSETYCACNDDRPNNGNEIPTVYNLYQNYPNPFNPITNIRFDLPIESNVKLTIYDLSGKEIITLINGTYAAGQHNIEFDGSNLSSGLYIYKLETPNYLKILKMVLVK